MKRTTFLFFFVIFFIIPGCLFALILKPDISQEERDQEENAPKGRSQKFFLQEEKPQKIKQIKVGNFMLPTAQQPGPLIGFGQNIVDKHDFQTYLFATRAKGDEDKFIIVAPSFIYGISDTCSLYFLAPYYTQNRQGTSSSKGIGDILTQIEYVVYATNTYTSQFQVTIVNNITWPSGSTKKNPNTGFGANSFFAGFTANYQELWWYIFTSHGAELTTKHKGTKYGNQFYYQWGFSQVMWTYRKWLYIWQLELDGFYTQRNKINYQIDKNSGGNLVTATPSLWISSKRWLLQFGLSFPLYQKYYGKQDKVRHIFNMDTAWTFRF